MVHEERLKAALADRYQIEREIGSGGMATVFLARDLKHHRQVAIKVLRTELAATLGPERFVREIEIAAKLSHPHILPLFDSGEADGILYYVMPFVEGESLRERLDREGRLSVAETVRLVDEIASALSYAHEQGVVHRDVKPENIMLSGGRAVVADFGIGRAVTAAGGDRLTGTGFAVGTPAYMSPEQAFGDANVDSRSDVYSLGCVAYEMVSGHAPFEAETPQALLAKQAAGTVPSLRATDPTILLFFERAVERALAKRPTDRFQSASAFAEALTSEMVVARVGGRWASWRAPAGAAIGVVVVAAWWLSTVMGGPAYERLAVLPPVNIMNDAEQEHIIQGMLNGLISELGQAGITVIGSVQSMMRYRDSEMTPREIAAEMGVDAVLESFFLWQGDSVAIDVRLTDGRSEESLWSHHYDEDARNVLLLFRQVTGAVADEIHAELTPQAEAHLASARPVNRQAFEAWLQGEFYLEKLTPRDIDTALEYFEMAREIDPDYALAYTGIGLAWGFRQQMGFAPPSEAAPKARAAVARATDLDSTLVEVQYALALLRTWTDWDWEGAEAAYRRAIQLNPNFPDVRANYSHFLCMMLRQDEAMPQIERAIALDPFNPLFQNHLGWVLYFGRRYDEAIAQFQDLLRRAPNYLAALGGLVEVYHAKGMYEEEVAAQRSAYTVTGFTEEEEALASFYAEGDYQGAMRRFADTLVALRSVRPVSPWQIAGSYLSAGEKNQALDWLERSFEERNPMMPYLSVYPFVDPLRGDPRFQDLLRRMKLPISPQGN
jgi:TolB-like protein/Tfp pilus assembly protein PilF